MHRPISFEPAWVDFFTSPCPYFKNKRKIFTLFPKLPKEIQLMIWDLAIGEPRALFIDVVPDPKRRIGENTFPRGVRDPHPGKKLKLQCRMPIPATLHVNYDSRKAALKVFDLAFAAQLGHPLYINFAQDILTFTSRNATFLFVGSTPTFGVSVKHTNSVQYVMTMTEHLFDDRILLWNNKHFHGLKHHLIVCRRDLYGEQRYLEANESKSRRLGHLPQVCRSDSKWACEMWKDIEWRIKRKAGQNWKRPIVTVGTTAQWNNVMKDGLGIGWVVGREHTWGMIEQEPMEWEPTISLPEFNFTPLYGREA